MHVCMFVYGCDTVKNTCIKYLLPMTANTRGPLNGDFVCPNFDDKNICPSYTQRYAKVHTHIKSTRYSVITETNEPNK